MTSRELENLASIGQLKRTPATDTEIDALVRSGEARLKDVGNASLALESRFDLAYNAAHALALAALRRHGCRSESRYIVFQTLPHTLGVSSSVWRLLAKSHGLRNQAEYEGMKILSLCVPGRGAAGHVRQPVAGDPGAQVAAHRRALSASLCKVGESAPPIEARQDA